MRIAFVTPAVNKRTGTNMFLAATLQRLTPEYEATVFSSSIDDVDLSRIKFHRVPCLPDSYPKLTQYFSFLMSITRILQSRRKEFDVIHTTGGDCLLGHIVTSNFCQQQRLEYARSKVIDIESPTTVHKLHTWLYMHVVSSIERRQYREVSLKRIMPVSRGLGSELIRHYQCDPGKITVIPNGVDTTRFHPKSRLLYRDEVRSELGLKKEDMVAIFVGGDWGRKGLRPLLQAFSLVTDVRLKLLVAGRDRAIPQYRALVERLGLESRVRFLGHCADVVPYLAASDFFIMPSSYEAFSVAMLEAASAGLPLLVTRINGAEELVRDGFNGLFVNQDPGDLATNMRKVASDPNFLAFMSSNSRKVIERGFSWDSIAERVQQVYQESILASRTSALQEA